MQSAMLRKYSFFLSLRTTGSLQFTSLMTAIALRSGRLGAGIRDAAVIN